MKRTVLLFSIAIALFFACQNKSNQTDGQNTTTAPKQDTAIDMQNHEEHEERSSAVILNNGQKWKTNAETTDGMKKMSSLFETFAKQPKAEDYYSLKTKLEKEFDTILQKCTMTGEAHNQLHNYLLPMKELIGKLGSNSTEEQQEALDNLQAHLKEYDKYFQ